MRNSSRKACDGGRPIRSIRARAATGPTREPARSMALVTVRPTRINVGIANEIAAHTDPALEDSAEVLTWGADEHLLLAVAAAGWLYARQEKPQALPLANHVLTIAVVTTILPH